MRIPRLPIEHFLRLMSLLCLAAAALCGQESIVRIGVVLDGPSDHTKAQLDVFERETSLLLGGEFDIQIPADKQLAGDWTTAGLSQAVDQLLADTEVDLVVALGPLGSNDLGRREVLPKPVFAALVLDPVIQGVPIERRERSLPGEATESVSVSGVSNLSYVLLGGDAAREVRFFQEIAPFCKLTVLYMEGLQGAVPEIDSRIRESFGTQRVRVDPVAVGASLEDALAKAPSDTDAVFVAPLEQLSAADRDRLVQLLIERKLPSFSSDGRDEVERGLLATLWPEQNILSRARRVALNIQQVLDGANAGDLPVDFRRAESRAVNMATARAIGVSPTFQAMTEIDLIHEEPPDVGRSLSLAQVVREASEVNLDLLAARRTVEAGLQLVSEARARLLPQFGIGASASAIDKDRADMLLGLNPQRRAAAGAEFNQLIYSEDVKAGYDIERNLQELRTEEREQLRLDVVLEGADSYLNVLRTKTVERIQKANLQLTRRNLELSRARVEIGQAGLDEVFRWESEIATNRRNVVEASAGRNQAGIAVNRVLNRPVEEGFLAVEAGSDDPELVTSFEQIRPYIESPGAFAVFRGFMAQEAFEASPELKQIDAVVLAQERELKASQRAFYVPTVGFSANAEYFGRGGVGSEPNPELPIPFADQFNWNLLVNAGLPLFQGGALRARRSRAEIELDELTLQRDAARQRVDQRIRSILHQVQASFVGIDLTRDAADAAQRNLELVSEQYAEGIVDILRLLDAQNQALQADLAAANAVFDYLTELMGAQRAVGRFDYYRSPEDRASFLSRLDEFFQESGYRVRTR